MCNSTNFPLQYQLTSGLWGLSSAQHCEMLEKLKLKEIKEGFLLKERQLISHHAHSMLCFHTSQSYLGFFQYKKVFWLLRVWGFGGLCCSVNCLTAVFARSNCITYLPPQLFSLENYIEIKSNNLRFGRHLLRLPGDRCLTVGNVK